VAVTKQKQKNSFCIFAVTADVRALIMKTDFHLLLHNIELALVIACQNVSGWCVSLCHIAGDHSTLWPQEATDSEQMKWT